jgi:flavorubredoxin
MFARYRSKLNGEGEESMSELNITKEEPLESHQMKVLVVYDSLYGNTEKIAKTIADSIIGEVRTLRVGEVNVSELGTLGLLIVGSPTQGGRPTPAIQDFLNNLSEPIIRSMRIAAFDTRMAGRCMSGRGRPERWRAYCAN